MVLPAEAVGLAPARPGAMARGRITAIGPETITVDRWRLQPARFWRKRHERMAGK